MNIGLAIQQIRKELGHTQFELAERCGLSATSLSQIENGHKRPSQKTIKRICIELDVPEVVIYLAAMQETDIPENKKTVYKLIYPSIMSLVMQMVNSEHALILDKML